jgi:hypothetical protein
MLLVLAVPRDTKKTYQSCLALWVRALEIKAIDIGNARSWHGGVTSRRIIFDSLKEETNFWWYFIEESI